MLTKSLSALVLGTSLLVAGQVSASASELNSGSPSACSATIALAPVDNDAFGTYDRDYSADAMPAGSVRTAYRLGQGAAASAAGTPPVTLAAAAAAAFEPAVDDGLGNYNGDYSAATRAGAVRTAYQVGRGGAVHLHDTLARAGDPAIRGQKTL